MMFEIMTVSIGKGGKYEVTLHGSLLDMPEEIFKIGIGAIKESVDGAIKNLIEERSKVKNEN